MPESESPEQLDGMKYSCPVREELKRHIYHRSASLSDVEKLFLSSLLIDKSGTIEEEKMRKNSIMKASKVLTNDLLFTVPFKNSSVEDSVDCNQKVEKKQSLPSKFKRSNPQLGEYYHFY